MGHVTDLRQASCETYPIWLGHSASERSYAMNLWVKDQSSAFDNSTYANRGVVGFMPGRRGRGIRLHRHAFGSLSRPIREGAYTRAVCETCSINLVRSHFV